MKVHHIGYLVKKIEKAVERFEQLGYQKESEIIKDDIRGIYICFLEKDGYRVELVSPFATDSVVSGLLKQYKNAPYHICYESKCFDEDIAMHCANGFTLIQEPKSAPAIQNCRVAFLMSAVIGMIEILDIRGLK